MLGRFKEQLGGLCRRAVGGGVCRPCVRGVGKPGFCDAEGHGKSCRFPLKRWEPPESFRPRNDIN